LPLVLLEAMSCGLPFVSTNVGAIPDAARGNPDAILVEPEARSIADGVRSLCERLVTGGFNPSRQREFFLKNFSNESFGERWRTMLADPEAFFRQ
jgi:glycosyltransferase involved in cell wall biosynthesis